MSWTSERIQLALKFFFDRQRAHIEGTEIRVNAEMSSYKWIIKVVFNIPGECSKDVSVKVEFNMTHLATG